MKKAKCPKTTSGNHHFEYIHTMEIEKEKHGRIWNWLHSMDTPSPLIQFIICRCTYCGMIDD